MATSLRLQCLIIIGVCLYTRFSHGFPCSGSLPPAITGDHAVKIITYGEPCHTPRYLPVRIEAPVPPVEDCAVAKSYQPLKLNYQTVHRVDQPRYIQSEYPVSIEVPRVPTSTTPCAPDHFRGRSYTYNAQFPPPPPTPITPIYNLDLQVLPPSPVITTPPKPVKLLRDLTGRIDRVVIPACDKPSCSCKAYTA